MTVYLLAFQKISTKHALIPHHTFIVLKENILVLDLKPSRDFSLIIQDSKPFMIAISQSKVFNKSIISSKISNQHGYSIVSVYHFSSFFPPNMFIPYHTFIR